MGKGYANIINRTYLKSIFWPNSYVNLALQLRNNTGNGLRTISNVFLRIEKLDRLDLEPKSYF